MSEAMDWILHISAAVIIGILIVLFIGQRTIVFDVSMQPTLIEGDNLVVEKVSKRFGGIHPGDIIVFKPPTEERRLVKRMVALEGDKVEIKDGKVFVNGVEFKTGLAKEPVTDVHDPKYSNFTVPKGTFFAMGDNREMSYDCRDLGPIQNKYITGRAIFRFYPFNKIGTLK